MRRFFPRRQLLILAAILAYGTSVPALAQTQNWPTQPVKLVVGYPAGGATDVLARIVAVQLGQQLGRPVIVDNRAGANSNLGAELVARAPADGYTLFVFTSANTANATLYSKLNYDPLKDFEPIGIFARITNVLVVNPSLPIRNLADYVRFAKETKDGITFASSGSGSSVHLSGEKFKMEAKLNMLHVPYKGSAPAITDLMGGHVQSMFDNIPSALQHVKMGKLRAIAVTSAQRSPLLPDVPTIAESGFPGFEISAWFGLAAPAGTPKTVVDRVNTALAAVLAVPETRQRLLDMGATPATNTPDQMRTFVDDEIKRWGALVNASGAKTE